MPRRRLKGLGPAKSTDDIWERKRGRDDADRTALHRNGARRRHESLRHARHRPRQQPVCARLSWSFDQFDDTLAIVVVDGKEQFFDPGQRYCAYGHLAWKHTLTQGIRQTDGGTVLAPTLAEPYTSSRTQRIANLTLDEHGEVTGNVKMAWTGDAALNWRHTFLRGDATSLNHDLRTAMENMLPNGMDVKVASIENLEDYEKPLTVSYTVKGAIGSPTGKRLLLPGDLFEVNTKPAFSREKRETTILFSYTHIVQDALRINFPANFSIESAPANEQIPLATKFAAYAPPKPKPPPPASPFAASSISATSFSKPRNTPASEPSTTKSKPRTRNPSS